MLRRQTLRVFAALLLAVNVRAAVGQEGESSAAAEGGGRASHSTAVPAETAPADETLSQWIADLDSNRYVARERASRNLLRHGRLALDGLAAAADGERPEAAARAINVLEELSAREEDPELQMQALERLAALQSRPSVARRAYDKLAQLWEQVSLPLALEMGGRFDPDSLLLDPASGKQYYDRFIVGPQWTGGDAGLVHVSRLRSVSRVSIRRADVTAEGLTQLVHMRSLTHLELFGLDFNDEDVQALQQALPNVMKFDIRSGAMLGVHGHPAMPSAQVIQVQPGSAAEMAGLEQGDVIIQVNDKEVSTFDELTAEIAKQQPGESAVLTVLRNEERLELSVTFGYWE